MIRNSLVVLFVAALSFSTACGGEQEPDISVQEDAVRAATLRLVPAAGSSTDFGSALIGTSVARTFVVTNVGTRLSTSRLSLSLTGTDFAILPPTAGDCVGGTTVLGPGSSCSVRVRFTPSAQGARTATLSAHANTGGTASLALTGVGIAPALLFISPSSLTFPTTTVGNTSAAASFTVANAGGSTTSLLSLTLNDPTDFRIQTTTCTGALAAGATCSLAVSFAPSRTGSITASLSLTATIGGTAVAALSGTGII
jgi:hypothetical protein